MHNTRAGPRTICTEVFRWPHLFLTVTPSSVDMLTRSREGRLGATPKDVERSGRFARDGYAEIGLQRCPILAEQINRTEPRYSAKGYHITDVTAHPRPLSVTESFVLPPRPKVVNMSHGIREWLVPPILLPILLVLLVAAAMLIQW